MSRINAMVLAAGLGTRLRPYTNTRPKLTIPFMTVPLTCFPLALWERQNVDNLVVNTHYLPDQVESLFKGLRYPCRHLHFSHEPEILDSGGGIRQALPKLLGHGEFLVANADEVVLPHKLDVVEDALDFHRFHKGIATLIAMEHPEVGKQFGGMWLKDQTEVTAFSKQALPGHRGLHYVGMMILSDRVQNYFRTDLNGPGLPTENILYDTLTRAMQAGEKVHAHQIQTEWFETGNPADFIKGVRACVRELSKPQPAFWADWLMQIVRMQGTRELLIENSDPALAADLQRLLPKWIAGL